jgi:hypothetical protein
MPDCNTSLLEKYQQALTYSLGVKNFFKENGLTGPENWGKIKID